MRNLPSCLPILALTWLIAACGSAAPTPSVATAAGADAGGNGGVSDVASGASDTVSADSAVGDAPAGDAVKTDAVKADASKPDAKADSAADTQADSVTSPPTVCGDTFCGDGEDCLNCDYDCGPCEAKCGDGQCGPTETCSACPQDCGQCAGACGNGKCEPEESCKSCPADCGKCPGSCGDGTCDAGEDCDGCPGDCGKCSAVPCDPFNSAGCKDFEQCFPYSGGDLVCLGAGAGAKGQACTYLVDCQKGLICINNACQQICDATGVNKAYGCPAGKTCTQIGQSGKASAASGACL